MTTQNAPQNVMVELEFTPNPNTLKYSTSVPLILAGAANFTSPDQAKGRSALAEKLFALNGITAIMVGRSFVTVTLANQETLTDLNEQIINTIKQFVESGEKALSYDVTAEESAGPERTDIEQKIVKILDEEIRPAVAMDGGDITFHKFDSGVVYLEMKGSCSGCPSSTATLKMGIENRLRDAIPEVLEVVSV